MSKKQILSSILAISIMVGCIGAGHMITNANETTDTTKFEEFTLEDFGIDDSEITNESVSGVYDNTSLDGTAVTLNITFPKATKNYYYIGGEKMGIRFEPQTNGSLKLVHIKGAAVKTIATLTADKAGVSALTETSLKLKVTFEFLNEASGKADVKLGIYFNDKLYNDEYLTVTGRQTSTLAKQVYFTASKNDVLKVSSIVIENDEDFVPEVLPDNLFRTTFYDFGFSDGKLSSSRSVGGGTIIGTLFSGYVSFHGKDVWFQYGGKGTGKNDYWYGMRFACDGKKITLSASNREFKGSYSFYSAAAKTELIDNEFLLQISAEAVDYDNDSQKDDVKLGVWFDGLLYKNEYIYMIDSVDKFGNNVALLQKDWDPKVGYAVVKSYVEKSDIPEQLPTDLTEYTFTDYNLGPEVTTSWKTKIKHGSIMDTMFSGYFTVDGNMWFQYGGIGTESDRFWYGIRMNFTGDTLVICSSDGEFRGKYLIDPEVAGTEFYNNRFLLQLTTRRIDCDNDGQADDVQFGVWFNGVLYNNTYFYLRDAADKLGRNMAMIQPNRVSSKGRATIGAIKRKVDLSQYGFDDNWAKTLGLL